MAKEAAFINQSLNQGPSNHMMWWEGDPPGRGCVVCFVCQFVLTLTRTPTSPDLMGFKWLGCGLWVCVLRTVGGGCFFPHRITGSPLCPHCGHGGNAGIPNSKIAQPIQTPIPSSGFFLPFDTLNAHISHLFFEPPPLYLWG